MGALEDYYAKWGVDQYGNKLGQAANTSGLAPGSVSTSYQPAQYSFSQYDANKNPIGTGTLARGPSQTSTYSGPSGTWSSSGGAWTDAAGRSTTDLGGLLQKGSLQRTGSDFSAEQNQLTDLLTDPSKIQQTAGYQFDIEQGNQAINRSAAARGQLGGGGVLAELAKYGQGMASKEYGNQVSRLSDLISRKQQFGVGSGYFDDLRAKNQPVGGVRTGGFSTPGMSYDPRGV